ncbi:MAG: hypothetical protein EXR98_16140, partial [Gemmataceae bacterium]|nr:hypothetical protein [Gemmataceae bacterium]
PYGFGPPPYGFGPPPYGFGPPPYGFGPPPYGFGPPPYGFGPPPYEFGPPPYGFGPPPLGACCLPSTGALPIDIPSLDINTWWGNWPDWMPFPIGPGKMPLKGPVGGTR